MPTQDNNTPRTQRSNYTSHCHIIKRQTLHTTQLTKNDVKINNYTAQKLTQQS